MQRLPQHAACSDRFEYINLCATTAWIVTAFVVKTATARFSSFSSISPLTKCEGVQDMMVKRCFIGQRMVHSASFKWKERNDELEDALWFSKKLQLTQTASLIELLTYKFLSTVCTHPYKYPSSFSATNTIKGLFQVFEVYKYIVDNLCAVKHSKICSNFKNFWAFWLGDDHVNYIEMLPDEIPAWMQWWDIKKLFTRTVLGVFY